MDSIRNAASSLGDRIPPAKRNVGSNNKWLQNIVLLQQKTHTISNRPKGIVSRERFGMLIYDVLL